MSRRFNLVGSLALLVLSPETQTTIKETAQFA
jgi:hypothetical protein